MTNWDGNRLRGLPMLGADPAADVPSPMTMRAAIRLLSDQPRHPSRPPAAALAAPKR